ncbi:MAG: hypothetical protein K0U16_07275, partial [Gammaproteobacteria bacterium]|nr:hypothetical protein [Gammaproteobacteria bacterium]
PIHLKILNPRQAEAGKIKIGRLQKDKRPNKNNAGEHQLPEKLDHFILTKTERGEDGNFIEDTDLMQLLDKDKDGKIRRIPILLSSDDIDEVFPHTLACYQGRNLFCRGDGEIATRYELKKETREGRPVLVKTGNSQQQKCPCNLLNADRGLQCKPHGTLWCTIVAGEQTRIGARHSFRTTSWDSVSALKAGLEEIQRMVGTLVGPPLNLNIRPRRVKPKGKDRSHIVWVVHVDLVSKDIQELRERMLQQAQLRHNVAALAGRPLRLGLPAPGTHESAADQSQIQQEYHPNAAPEEDDEAEDVIDFDPTTGEVLNDPGDWHNNPSPEDESQESPPPEQLEPLAEDHAVRLAIKSTLTKIAEAREVPEAELKKARAAIWNEACEKAEYPRLPWGELNLYRAQRIEPILRAMLERYNEDAEI